MAVSFDLFGTLVDVDYPDDPAVAVAAELRERGVDVPTEFARAYREPHIDAPEGAEVPLPAHVSATLGSLGVDTPGNVSRRAVVAAFDPAVRTRPGAVRAVEAARERGPVGVLSNCSVPELVSRTLIRSALSRDAFDAIVSSVACGWRKPAPAAFETVASELGVAASELVHVGDDPDSDGGVVAVGGRFVDVEEVPLSRFPAWLDSHGGRVGDESDTVDSQSDTGSSAVDSQSDTGSSAVDSRSDAIAGADTERDSEGDSTDSDDSGDRCR